MLQLCIIKFDAMFHLEEQENKKQSLHLVYITDKEGVFDAINQIKKELIPGACPYLSFIYAYSSRLSRLMPELEFNSLEKQFSKDLVVYKIPLSSCTDCISNEFMEALINSNISKEMKFILFGNVEFIARYSEILSFLGIKSFVITKSLICLMQ
jgi:hypothetical protein